MAAITQLRQGPTQTFNSVYSRFLEFRSQLPLFSDAMEMNAIKTMFNESYSSVLSAQAPCQTAAEMVSRLYHLDRAEKGQVPHPQGPDPGNVPPLGETDNDNTHKYEHRTGHHGAGSEGLTASPTSSGRHCSGAPRTVPN